MPRRRLGHPVLAGLGLLLALPAVYLLQWLVRPPDQVVLDGALEVRLDGRTIGRWAGRLAPSVGEEPARWWGEAPITGAAWPWPPTGSLGRLELLQAEDGWRASWTERRRRGPLPGGPTLPCTGRIEPHGAGAAFPRRTGVELLLTCRSAGPDLAWYSDDDHTWVLEGAFRPQRVGAGIEPLTPGVASR